MSGSISRDGMTRHRGRSQCEAHRFSRGDLLRERVCEASSRALQPSLFWGGSIPTGASHATRANCLDVDVEQICNLPGQHRSIWPLGSVVQFSEANQRLVPDSVEPYPHAVVNLIATIHRLGSLFQKRDECQETQRSLADVGRLFQTIRRPVSMTVSSGARHSLKSGREPQQPAELDPRLPFANRRFTDRPSMFDASLRRTIASRSVAYLSHRGLTCLKADEVRSGPCLFSRRFLQSAVRPQRVHLH